MMLSFLWKPDTQSQSQRFHIFSHGVPKRTETNEDAHHGVFFIRGCECTYTGFYGRCYWCSSYATSLCPVQECKYMCDGWLCAVQVVQEGLSMPCTLSLYSTICAGRVQEYQYVCRYTTVSNILFLSCSQMSRTLKIKVWSSCINCQFLQICELIISIYHI